MANMNREPVGRRWRRMRGTVANLLRTYEMPVAEARLRFDELRE